MARYLMLGKYSYEAVKGIKAERTKKVEKVIKDAGGKVEAMYALLGSFDLAFIVEFPSEAEVMAASIAITKLTGIGFTTLPAIEVEKFDRLVG